MKVPHVNSVMVKWTWCQLYYYSLSSSLQWVWAAIHTDLHCLVNKVIWIVSGSKWTADFQLCQSASKQLLRFWCMKMKLPLGFTGDYLLFVVKIMWMYCALLGEKIKEKWWKCRPKPPSTIWKACHCNSQFAQFMKIDKLLKQPEQKS